MVLSHAPVSKFSPRDEKLVELEIAHATLKSLTRIQLHEVLRAFQVCQKLDIKLGSTISSVETALMTHGGEIAPPCAQLDVGTCVSHGAAT